MKDLVELERIIKSCWDAETTNDPLTWSPENPSAGQCVPTSLIINDYFGGKIEKVKTLMSNGKTGSHYFNLINKVIYDLTRDQYPLNTHFIACSLSNFPDEKSLRDYLLSSQDTKRRYELLKKRVEQKLAKNL
jgi:hypothetical protein